MKIGIVGGGASGCYLAIRLKELHPSFDVEIIERNDKLMKKIAVTGNGRCNYANLGSLDHKYNNDFARKIINNLSPQEIVDTFDRLGIHPTYIDNLVFPISLSAQTVILMLEKRLKELGVVIHLEEKVVDYALINHKYQVKSEKEMHIYDALIFTSGGKAYPQLGTDGVILDVLKNHHYQIENLSPSLSPLKVKENTKKISGQRVKCLVSLYNKEQLYYQEEGEVLFKDDGISGIVILNMSQKINEIEDKAHIKIVLNLVPSLKVNSKEDYNQYVHPKIASYLLDNQLDINKLSFTFKAFYDFNVAEVSHGGLSLKEINDNLESKKEKNLFFAGELLDVDGMCGGYNLMFAFASAETIAKAIKE